MLPDILFYWWVSSQHKSGVSLSKCHCFDPTNGSGVLATFKVYYLRRIIAQAIATTEEDAEKTLMQFWKDYNIYNCMKALVWALNAITKESINSIWKMTFKRLVHDFKGFASDEEVAKMKKAVVEMAKNFHLVADGDDMEGLPKNCLGGVVVTKTEMHS